MAKEYNIETEKLINDELINSFKDSCDSIETIFQNKSKTLSWIWGSAENEYERQQHLKYLKENHGLILKNNQENK